MYSARYIKLLSGYFKKDVYKSLLYYIALVPYISEGILQSVFCKRRAFGVTLKRDIKDNLKNKVRYSLYSNISISVFALEVLLLILLKPSAYVYDYIAWILFLILLIIPVMIERYIIFNENKL